MRKRKRDVRDGGGEILKRLLGPKPRGRKAVAGRKPAVDKKAAKPNVGAAIRRSRLEDRVEGLLRDRGVPYEYEPRKLEYVVPESKHVYTPDFGIRGVVLETKGKFTPEDRKKMLNVLNSNPDELLIMVFPQPNNRLRKNSKTTYAEWCDKNGVPWISVDELEQILNRKDYYDHLQQRAGRVGLPGGKRGRKGAAAGAR